MKRLLKGGRVVDPANGIDGAYDVLIDGDRIARVEKNLPKPERVSGGGSRAVYYRNPDRVQVIRGKDVNGSRSPRPSG